MNLTNKLAIFPLLSPHSSHKQSDERSYTGMCIGITEERCDFSRELAYMGSYILRVRAEGRGQMSDWYRLEFVPDEHGEANNICNWTCTLCGCVQAFVSAQLQHIFCHLAEALNQANLVVGAYIFIHFSYWSTVGIEPTAMALQVPCSNN